MKTLWNDGWVFLKTQPEENFTDVQQKAEEFQPVDVPHDWLIYDATKLYEDSRGWYRKQFYWDGDREKRVFLTFEGVYMDCCIYINQAPAFEWKYGYSGFTFELGPFLQKGENEICVCATFRNPNSRWYSGAGIYRNVWLKITEKTYIAEDGIYISTRKRGEDFVLRVETELRGGKDREAVISHRLSLQGKEIPLQKVDSSFFPGLSKEKAESREENGSFFETQYYLVQAPRLWDTEEPVLYSLTTMLQKENEILQQEENGVGFRETAFDPDRGFFLNGKHCKLKGVCEHHDLGALGAAVNVSAIRRKFRILKEMGVNAIRGSHNMMAPDFMRLADEMGFLMISEAFDMWERSKTEYDYARFFKDWHERDVASWVKRDRNHPSVILFSIGNEIYDTHAGERGLELTRELKELVEKYDPCQNARPTIGSNYMPWENAQKCADILKIAGYNYSEKYYEKHHREHPDWVIYGSETSSIVQSRGVYHFPLHAGILAEDDEQCSALGNSITSWGARSVENCITIDRDTPFSMGQFLWTGFDYIGEPTPYHTKNSYFGQVDTAGFPKDTYYMWKSAFVDVEKEPFVHVLPYWDFNPGQQIDIRVCSNAPVVELFLNGRSLGKQKLSKAPGSGKKVIADYQALYEPGELLAAAYDEEGRELARRKKHSFGDSKRIVLKPESTEEPADGVSLFFVEIGTCDQQGYPVENACDRVTVEVTGAGRLVGLDNGDSTDEDSYKGISRRLFNGKLLAMIQTDNAPGEIEVLVTAPGLIPARLSLYSAEGSSIGGMITKREKNTKRPVVTGREEEIPVRKITLTAPEGQSFDKGHQVLTAKAHIEPEKAQDHELIFQAVGDGGVPSNLVELVQEGNKAVMTAKGDGAFRLRCMSKSGTGKIRLISQLEFTITGMGQAYLDPYDFICGSLYTSFRGEVGNGNERGVATARDGETVVSYGNIDFGQTGSDEITIPIFALDSQPYDIQIYEGIPGKEGSSLLFQGIYQKPSIWNVYQPETFRLCRRLKGVTTISFLLHQKIHIKGFSFQRQNKAFLRLLASEADAVYGDSFQKREGCVEQIGNNVSLEFREMDFGEEGTGKLTICGRAPKGACSIHVRFFDGEEESKQIVEFGEGIEYEEKEFVLSKVKGKQTVTFVFMPGSCFDFKDFQFSIE